jgi:tetratricopeptide (TPR) repeat protein
MNAPSPQAAELLATFQQAVAHQQAGQLPEAEKLFRRILQARPDHPDTNNALAIVLKDQGKTAEATAAFQRVVDIAPNAPAAHNNLGTILFAQEKLTEAEASYRRALALDPNNADALKNLGLVLVDRGRSTESLPYFRRHAELVYGKSAPAFAPGRPPTPQHKIQHDQEQRDYLGKASGPAHLFNLDAGSRIPGRAVSPDISGEVAARWENSSPQCVVIDNLLTEEGLAALRQFCWRSTIWNNAHSNGYLRSMPEHGFACPLLAQIDEELRATFPTILADHPLLRWWAFKYDGRLKGTNVHADFAAVNINFWIAPDDANLDPESGGLIVWDKAAPLDWGFAQYNGAGQTVRDWLKDVGGKSIAVPHRANRAVVFDSDLFHETDKINFKDGYMNRRINITMLYGRREKAAG